MQQDTKESVLSEWLITVSSCAHRMTSDIASDRVNVITIVETRSHKFEIMKKKAPSKNRTPSSSFAWCRSRDLQVMSLARFHCATKLWVTTTSEFSNT